MLQRALSLAKKEGSKKVPVNFQVYPELKETFEELCRKNNVSITSMLTALMESAIEEARGIYFQLDVHSLMTINQRILEIEKNLSNYYDFDGENLLPNYDLDNKYIEQKLDSLYGEKYRLEKIVELNQRGGSNDESIEELKNTIVTMNQLIDNGATEESIGFDPTVVKNAAVGKLYSMAGLLPEIFKENVR